MKHTPTEDQRAAARHRQEVIAAYRAWLTYLDAQLTILASERTAPTVDAFEGATAAQERATTARQAIAALHQAQRDLFEAVYHQERQQEQQRQDAAIAQRSGTVTRVDPDAVAQAALTRLRQDAQGVGRSDGRGLVPRGTADAIAWLGIDLATVESAPPTETDYHLTGRRGPTRRQVITNGVLAVLALCLIPVVIMLTRPATASDGTAAVPHSQGSALVPWPVLAVRDADQTWRFPVEPTTTRWPATTAAAWLQGSSHPLELCLPAERQAALTELVVESAAGAPVRHYTLAAPVNAAPPDLLLHACDAPQSESPPRPGVLQRVESLPALAPGVTSTVGLILETITVVGQGDDPTLASGRMTLLITVRDPQRTDWLATPATIVLATGETAQASATDRDGDHVTFRYLVTATTAPFAVVWQLTAADGTLVRYRTTLAPPPSRDAVLRRAMRITDLTVVPSQQTMQVMFAVTNQGAAPLVLTPADLVVTTSAGPVTVAAPALDITLQPAQSQTLTVDLPLHDCTVQLGPFRYALTIAEGR
jgi:hypothetical protein